MIVVGNDQITGEWTSMKTEDGANIVVCEADFSAVRAVHTVGQTRSDLSPAATTESKLRCALKGQTLEAVDLISSGQIMKLHPNLKVTSKIG